MPTEVAHHPDHSRKRSLGWLADAWIHHFCIHGRGDILDTPLSVKPLVDELSLFVVDCYALDGGGRRLYDSAFLSRPKGFYKSGVLAFVAMFEAMGPCRFAGWATGGEVFEWLGFRYEYKRGEPMGRRVLSPLIKLMATEEGQTGNVYDTIHRNLTVGPLSVAFHRADDVGLTRTFLPDGGEIRPCTAGSASKDGGLESFAAFDETHLYILPALRQMYDTVRRNLSKRAEAEPWSLEGSTMYQAGQDSIAERSHRLAERIREGKERRPRFLFDHREGWADFDVDDEDALMGSLMESYGDAARHMNLGRLVSEFWDPRNDPQDSKRFYCNLRSSAGADAFDTEAWAANKRPRGERRVEIKRGELITLGFDGHPRQDATALVATHVRTGFQWAVAIWEGGLDNLNEATAAVYEAAERWRVWRLYADPQKWESQLAEWSGKLGKTVAIAWPTTHYRKMALTLKAFRGAINAGEVLNDGNEVLAKHIGNARRHTLTFRDDDDKPLWLIRKENETSVRPIDGAMAAALSWQARTDAIAAGEPVAVAKATGFWA